MTNLRECLVPCIDEARQLVDDLGLREYVVKTRHVTWDGTEIGRGTDTTVDCILRPTPKIELPAPFLIAENAGKYEKGDRIVKKLSRTYVEDELTGGSLSATEEWYWLIDDELYRAVRATKKNFEWRVHLRRANRL